MEFHEMLAYVCDTYQLSAKELSTRAGISGAAVSRYRSGKRKPDRETAEHLLSVILDMIVENGHTLPDEELQTIQQGLTIDDADFQTERFSLLIAKLNISLSELAPQVYYTPAYLSSIRSGKRQPANKARFLEGLCAYLKMHRQREDDRRILQILTGSNDLTDLSAVMEQWLWGTDTRRQDGMGNFLHSLDCFDLNQYMTMFHFETPEIPKELAH